MLRDVAQGGAHRNFHRRPVDFTLGNRHGKSLHREEGRVASSPQLPLADDLFLTAHDTVKGKSLLTPATLGLGLGAALIGELVLWRRLDLVDGKIMIIDDRPTGDPAVTAVL